MDVIDKPELVIKLELVDDDQLITDSKDEKMKKKLEHAAKKKHGIIISVFLCGPLLLALQLFYYLILDNLLHCILIFCLLYCFLLHLFYCLNLCLFCYLVLYPLYCLLFILQLPDHRFLLFFLF